MRIKFEISSAQAEAFRASVVDIIANVPAPLRCMRVTRVDQDVVSLAYIGSVEVDCDFTYEARRDMNVGGWTVTYEGDERDFGMGTIGTFMGAKVRLPFVVIDGVKHRMVG